MTYRVLLSTLIFVLASSVSATAQEHPQLPSVYSMVVGNETWELADNRQLTFSGDGEVTDLTISPDGKQVAYLCETPDHTNLCLINSGGGHSIIVIKTPMLKQAKEANIKEIWKADGGIIWSPNSKMLAFPATRITRTGGVDEDGLDDVQEDWYVLVLNSNGSQRAALPINERLMSLAFSPDSRKLTLDTTSYMGDPPTDSDPECNQVVYDVMSSPAKVISSNPSPSGWYQESAGDDGFLSRDGSISVSAGASGISVKDIKTGKSTQVVKSPSADLLSWLPGGKLICYKSPVAISSDADKAHSTLNTLWLLNPASEKLNNMCVALDMDDDQIPSWSSNCTRAAYTSRGRLYVAEIAKRPSSPYEKAAAGLPLNEDEMKTVLRRYAVMIDIALEQFAMDQQSYPASMEDLSKFVYPDVFYKPGTGELIFQFGGESADGVPLAGTYDAGYNWKIEIGQHGGINEVAK